jgi:hypothetical protein
MPTMDDALCRDAIVVIPGIMGSELIETDTRRVVWGLSVQACWRTWARPDGMTTLRVTSAELAGHTGRITARRLLTAPVFAPWLGGFEPYTRLVTAIRQVAPSPKQVLEFPYDWRLPVEFNARQLARECAQHLADWRRTVPSARLTLVAHSMGGLLARALTLRDIAAEAEFPLDIGATITMGTPFYGAVKAVTILGNGRPGASIRSILRGRMREAALTMPGVYDLLPRYRCLLRQDDACKLTTKDVGDIGASPELARHALEFGELLDQVEPAGHHAIVGVEQATLQSLTIDSGVVEGLNYGYREGATGLVKERRNGDGTVYRDSADLGYIIPLPQQHGALAKSPEAIAIVRDILTRGEHRGPRLGAGEIGIDPPDVVETGAEWTVEVTGVTSPSAARCTVTNLAAPWRVTSPRLERHDGSVQARVTLPEPGLYRLAIQSGGSSPVTQVVAASGHEIA